jgi:hypothetical protein
VSTLSVRPLAARDLPALRHVRQHSERLDVPFGSLATLPEIAGQVLSALPLDIRRERVYVALVDDQLSALAMMRQQTHRYRWDVVLLSAGGSRVDERGPGDDCVEVWAALLEFAIKEAGASGAKRLFATAMIDTPAYESLNRAGFDPYSRFTVVAGFLPASPIALPDGLRGQDPSDVWSIHQLYHHVTPDGVQFAEALTSSAWDIETRSLVERIGARRPQTLAYVLESDHGIEAYCRIERIAEAPVMTLMRSEECRTSALQLVAATASVGGLHPNRLLRVVIPAYTSEYIREFENEGFYVECERVAMIRHTTSRVAVRARPVPVLVEAGERVPKGVPTYYRVQRNVPLDGQ